jgi:hypothetical protein
MAEVMSSCWLGSFNGLIVNGDRRIVVIVNLKLRWELGFQ